MRDSGRDRDPAGCEVSRGSPAGKRAHLGSASAEKLLTEEPSCEAEDMTAPTTSATPKFTLDQRAAMVWTPPTRRGLRSAVHCIEGEPPCTSFVLAWTWRNMSSRFMASIAMARQSYAGRFVAAQLQRFSQTCPLASSAWRPRTAHTFGRRRFLSLVTMSD